MKNVLTLICKYKLTPRATVSSTFDWSIPSVLNQSNETSTINKGRFGQNALLHPITISINRLVAHFLQFL